MSTRISICVSINGYVKVGEWQTYRIADKPLIHKGRKP